MRCKVYITRSGKDLGSPWAGILIRRAARAALRTEGIACRCRISVLLTNDEGIRELNREFRKKDACTDVLSFPANAVTAGGFKPEESERDPATGRINLGDMAISLERARAQGREYAHGEKRELQYLTVHSCLHLLGYDHEDEAEEKKTMRQREKLIMTRLNRTWEQR